MSSQQRFYGETKKSLSAYSVDQENGQLPGFGCDSQGQPIMWTKQTENTQKLKYSLQQDNIFVQKVRVAGQTSPCHSNFPLRHRKEKQGERIMPTIMLN